MEILYMEGNEKSNLNLSVSCLPGQRFQEIEEVQHKQLSFMTQRFDGVHVRCAIGRINPKSNPHGRTDTEGHY